MCAYLQRSFEKARPAGVAPLKGGASLENFGIHDNRSQVVFQHRAPEKQNNTGIPDALKSAAEHFSGIDLSDVRVNYNSEAPSRLQAHAYARGSEIHLAAGQEKHLPHELSHVIQQKQGRVKPTGYVQSLPVNDEQKLEDEADRMGAKLAGADIQEARSYSPAIQSTPGFADTAGIIQGVFTRKHKRSGSVQKYTSLWLNTRRDALGGAWYIAYCDIVGVVGLKAWSRFEKGVNDTGEIDITEDDEMLTIIRMIRDHWNASEKMEDDKAVEPAPVPMKEHVNFSFSTHNVEKYGERTKDRTTKAGQEASLMSRFQPDVASMQEVTRPDLLIQDMDAIGVDDQYKIHPGPQYESGTYKESYSLAFNTGSVHFQPELSFIDPATNSSMPYSQTLSFGKQAAQENGDPEMKQARPTSYWDIPIPAGPNLRPAYKHTGDAEEAEAYAKKHQNLRHRRHNPYLNVRQVNVHTSPGKSTPTINKQVNGIMEDMEMLSKEEPNTMASGDFYMQKGSKQNWKRLRKGTDKLKLVAPGVATNFKKGRGIQTADHFVVPANWSGTSAHALPPPERKETNEELLARGKDVNELAKWEKSGIDHAFVFGRAQVPVPAPGQGLVDALTLYLQHFFAIIYRQNNCLIQAIADAAGINLTGPVTADIRNQLSKKVNKPVPIGDFIEASEENIGIIMRALGIYGIVRVFNVEHPEQATLPIFIAGSSFTQTRNVVLEINYSYSHFYASPRTGQ
ncbi:DUF4157 domain-containing protein [Fulvivirgaceae bacterium PWU4]|uniref:DUF4157 domain-containing protein n=1 Tax=Chryseosolibacter histidini TaxID=2782349 RepID=A0AAP2DJI9_9BACT|nr:DUF4157 domain-containing protein [Chryseosolibacter histidini]MBT1697516.1 DUF4157 domain-containing protein [Chryseosolibacter histidini]